MSKYLSVRPLVLMAFAIIILITCWQSNRTNIALADPAIPEQSIRLRILANSDSMEDQVMKRLVRDAIIAQMNTWVKEADGLARAREIVTEQLPVLEDLVIQKLASRGYHYAVHVELGQVPFPTKMYGDRVYPAGNYEALRVTLGRGEGQNWWCVLFPPLCFVDAITGVAMGKSKVVEDSKAPSLQIKTKKQVHFYFWDKTKLLLAKL